MSTHANQANSSANRAASVRDVVTFREIITVGAIADGYLVASDDPAITITRTSAGLFALTYPKGKKAWIDITLLSPAATVVGCILTAIDATAGTASFNTLAGSNAAAVTDPAVADAFQVTITVER